MSAGRQQKMMIKQRRTCEVASQIPSAYQRVAKDRKHIHWPNYGHPVASGTLVLIVQATQNLGHPLGHTLVGNKKYRGPIYVYSVILI
jgi:hypothetical protein